ncbi:MAG: sulfide/dihydroorotate dehydrogenase-like FAD/NAD-binding protein [Acidobacteriota bacterium]
MTFPIVDAAFLAPDIKRFVVRAPRIARKRQPGQFVIVRVHELGERVPLTIADADPEAGTITIIVQGIGKTTKLLNALDREDAILDVAGPLGTPSEVRRYGTVVVIGGGVGTAIAYPTAVAMKRAGNRILAIVGARSAGLVILESEMRAISDELHVMTDDGSRGDKGVVTDRLGLLLERERIDLVLAIGPVPMMRAVAETTRPRGVRTVVSLNAIMVDGTEMCGGCRVLVGGKSRFACVDGPEFDAHDVDFDVLAARNAMYRDAERASLERWERDPARDLSLAREPCPSREAP